MNEAAETLISSTAGLAAGCCFGTGVVGPRLIVPQNR
jgi:hypothetical protein